MQKHKSKTHLNSNRILFRIGKCYRLIPPPYRTGQTSDAISKICNSSKEDSSSGVSIRSTITQIENNSDRKWFALRATYGRERKAYEFIKSKGTETFCPTITSRRIINGKSIKVTEALIPNMLFAYGTEDEIKAYVYNNTELPYLRFCYRYFHLNNKAMKRPLVVPDYQMKSFMIICNSGAEDIIYSHENIEKFTSGQSVRIINGPFEGVEGKVARYQGQQRVAVIIDNLLTITTAYVPSAFLEKI